MGVNASDTRTAGVLGGGIKKLFYHTYHIFNQKVWRGFSSNGGGMASKGLRAISYQVTRKVEAGYNPSHTSETLICYTAC